jgi:hypothetical protein
MTDDYWGVDQSIKLQPLDNFGRPKPPPRRLAVYVLVGGAALLSLATIAAFVWKIAAVVRERNTPVIVTAIGEPAASRAEAVRAFSEFDAFDARQKQPTPDAKAEQEAILALLRRLEESVAQADEAQFRSEVDVARFVKRIELSGSVAGWRQSELRALRSQLKDSVDSEPSWARLVVTATITPRDDSNTRVVYAYGWDTSGGEHSEHRLWLGRDGSNWKLYDWERLDLGMPESRRWGLYLKYGESPLLEGHNRWANTLQEVDRLVAQGERELAKEKLRFAETQSAPPVLGDFLWMLTGHRWLSLGESAEAERCYRQIHSPISSPGAYLGL